MRRFLRRESAVEIKRLLKERSVRRELLRSSRISLRLAKIADLLGRLRVVGNGLIDTESFLTLKFFLVFRERLHVGSGDGAGVGNGNRLLILKYDIIDFRSIRSVGDVSLRRLGRGGSRREFSPFGLRDAGNGRIVLEVNGNFRLLGDAELRIKGLVLPFRIKGSAPGKILIRASGRRLLIIGGGRDLDISGSGFRSRIRSGRDLRSSNRIRSVLRSGRGLGGNERTEAVILLRLRRSINRKSGRRMFGVGRGGRRIRPKGFLIYTVKLLLVVIGKIRNRNGLRRFLRFRRIEPNGLAIFLFRLI